MMMRYFKLYTFFALAGLTVILSTTVLSLGYMKRRKMQKVERKKAKANNDQISDAKKENNNVSKSKTIRKSYPVDPSTDLYLYRKVAPNTENYQTAADAHLGKALRIIPFETEGGRELKGNALPPPLLHGEVGEGRGANFVKRSWEKQAENIGRNSKDAATRRRKGGLVRMIRDVLAGNGSLGAKKDADEVNGSDRDTENYQIEEKAIFHLEKAAEMGNSYAQNMIANVLASGILPVTNSPKLREGKNGMVLKVHSDFTDGGHQLARALMLWHLSAMDGNIEAAMALGYRHLFSAQTGDSKIVSDESLIASYVDPTASLRAGSLSHSSSPSAHYGVLGTCESAMAYYEAAADGIMDEIEASPLRGKVTPAIDQHRLAEIFQRGASSAQTHNNKPDELNEALTYYKMRASLKNPKPDVHAAYKLATMYHYGLKGVKQDMKQALEYYTIAADYGSWEAAGQAGKFHLWGMGLEESERDLFKAYKYFDQGSPGGLDGCQYRYNKNMRKKVKVADGNIEFEDDLSDLPLCDHPSVNGMGLLHIFGVPKTLVSVNVTLAHQYFSLARDMGNMDAYYNIAMLRLGWMNPEYGDSLSNKKTSTKGQFESGPSKKDYQLAVTYLDRAAKKGHFQAQYRLAKIYARGATQKKKNGRGEVVAVHSSCVSALKLYKQIAYTGTTISKRMRVAYKQYTTGDYESSLRNYIAAAETGSMDAQVNAAFLFEQGHCLGMDSPQCLKASLRMWKAAARQGNEEACLRVGDFYYYNRVGDSTETKHANVYSITTSPYTRYFLYPEDLLKLMSKSMIAGMRTWSRTLFRNMKSKEGNVVKTEIEVDNSGSCSAKDNIDGTCQNPQSASFKNNDDAGKKRLTLAAKYYRKAAEDHGSERANFNLGFMHEYGLGLTQDFPLAKRHYDLAAAGHSGEGIIAVQIALTCMNLHEYVLKLEKQLFEYIRVHLWSNTLNSAQHQQPLLNEGDNLMAAQRLYGRSVTSVILFHIFSWESAIILALLVVLVKLLRHKLNRN